MSRIKLLLDLVTDIRTVADDLETIAKAIGSDETPQEEKQEVPQKKEEEKTPALKLSDVRAVLAAKSREGYGDKVRALIEKFGANKLSEIDPAHYSEILKEAEGFGSAT